MACNCSEYINCNDKPRETYDGSASNSDEHQRYDYMATISNMPFAFTRKVARLFDVAIATSSHPNTSHFLVGCSEEAMPCSDGADSVTSCTQSENCAIESNVPYYIDHQKKIYVWKHTIETVEWSITSDKTAAFKMKWGVGHFNKICIPNTVVGSATETFKMSINGVESVLATKSFTWNPFPSSDMPGGVWGQYGDIVDQSGTPPDTENVALILLFPVVPKQAMPLDNDVKHYGFYDYNATDAGFVETGLPKDDGGKDYFYPYWCRSMSHDRLWRDVADERYEVIYSKGEMNLAGSSNWTVPTPDYYEFPFGGFAVNSKAAFVRSLILQFSDRAGGGGVVYNEASIGDLFAALTATGIQLGAHTAMYPVAPL